VSRIDELIAEKCPGGVSYKPLGELGQFIRGRRFTKNDYADSGIGSIHYGEIYTDYGTSATETRFFLRSDLKNMLRYAEQGDLIIAATGENVKDVCKAVAWLGNGAIAVHDDCYIFRHNLDPKFVAYFFQSTGFQEQKIKYALEAKVVRISGANLEKIIAPAPPIEIQREIVKVLDKFAQLEADLKAELEAELEARRQQYAYYRDRLLTFGKETA
jgi:type I restriction enzyme S subunit